jgi:tetratricopeptide (TPR) repeat protein
MRRGHTDEALAEFGKALKADPSYYRTYQELGSAYVQRANYDEAAKYLAKEVELAPGEPAAHFALGVNDMNRGRFAEAEKELHNSIALQATPAALHTLGVTLIYEGRDREAADFIQRALEQLPDRYLYWFNLGVAYRRMNQRAESIHAFRRGLSLAEAEMARDPRDGMVRSQLAMLCAQLGDRSRAESEIAQALELSPDDADSRWAAAVTYEALREREKTLSVLAAASPGVLGDLNRWPDLADLHKDSRFLQLLASQ